MRTRAVVAAELAAKHAEQKGILDQGDALTAEGIERATALQGEIEALETELEAFNRADALRAGVATRSTALTTVATTPIPFQAGMQPASTALMPSTTVPAVPLPMGYQRRQNVFQPGPGPDGTALTGHQRAYRFGSWLLATIGGNERSRRYCRDTGIPLAYTTKDDQIRLLTGIGQDQFAHVESVNTSGGYLVPPEFENDLIVLRELYGVFRKNAKIVPMTSDTKSIPRRTGGLTAFFAAEAAAATESTKSWDRVNLTAKKLMAYSILSTELSEDAIIDVGSDLADEISYAFANKEDDCGFNGDGTSTYGGIVGVRTAFTNLSGTIANIAGLIVSTGTGYATDYSSVALADFNKVKGRLPQYAAVAPGGCAWYCHKSFYHNTMERLALAAGGVPAAEVVNGAEAQTPNEARFLGYPVRFSQIFPQNSAVSQVVCVFGNLQLAAKFGDRRMTTIAMSEHFLFNQDEIAVRGTERFDVVVHDVGNQSGTASARVPGPICGLITASS